MIKKKYAFDNGFVKIDSKDFDKVLKFLAEVLSDDEVSQNEFESTDKHHQRFLSNDDYYQIGNLYNTEAEIDKIKELLNVKNLEKKYKMEQQNKNIENQNIDININLGDLYKILSDGSKTQVEYYDAIMKASKKVTNNNKNVFESILENEINLDKQSKPEVKKEALKISNVKDALRNYTKNTNVFRNSGDYTKLYSYSEMNEIKPGLDRFINIIGDYDVYENKNLSEYKDNGFVLNADDFFWLTEEDLNHEGKSIMYLIPIRRDIVTGNDISTSEINIQVNLLDFLNNRQDLEYQMRKLYDSMLVNVWGAKCSKDNYKLENFIVEYDELKDYSRIIRMARDVKVDKNGVTCPYKNGHAFVLYTEDFDYDFTNESRHVAKEINGVITTVIENNIILKVTEKNKKSYKQNHEYKTESKKTNSFFNKSQAKKSSEIFADFDNDNGDRHVEDRHVEKSKHMKCFEHEQISNDKKCKERTTNKSIDKFINKKFAIDKLISRYKPIMNMIDYLTLQSTGMFYEMYPELSGNYKQDMEIINDKINV